jgi:DNA-directed RNA polymerase specialized sigma24 family protein
MGMEAAVEQSPPSPAHLVRAARRGDRAAFGTLVEPDLAAAYGTAGIVTGSSADAADAVQEALPSAWRGLESLRDAATRRPSGSNRATRLWCRRAC